jgi:hypothetical protein
MALQAVVGEDHGDTAFQFGVSVSADFNNGECLYFEFTTCELICKQDTVALLAKTILPHLTHGLNIMCMYPLHIYLTAEMT